MFIKMWENEIFILGIFCECGAGVGLNRSHRQAAGGRGGYAARSGAGVAPKGGELLSLTGKLRARGAAL